jgi:DNA-binding MarR family transcriptional regulator
VDRKTALEIGSSCFAFSLKRASRLVTRIYDDALRPAGLTNGQFSLMAVLVAIGDGSICEIADRLGLDRTTLNAKLKPLERSGLIRSELDTQDARIRRLSLTERGRQRLAEAEPLWRAAQAKVIARLDHDSAQQLRSSLRAIK